MGNKSLRKHFEQKKKIEFKKEIDEHMETLFWLASPFAFDSNTVEENQTTCFYSLSIENQKIRFNIETPADWLVSSNRVYPVYIDPTIQTLYPLEDTYSRSYRPDNIYGSSICMKVNPYPYDINRAYLKFDLSGIPSNSEIISATFRYYYYYHISNPGPRTHDFHKIIANWNEDTLTWNNQPSYDPTIVSSYLFPSSFGWIEAELTDYVQDKINGETDYGFLIKDRNEGGYNNNNNQPRMYSKEYGSYSPELVIEYSSCSSVILTEYPVDDSFVRSWKPNNVYGNSNSFTINPRTADICRTYLKFDLSVVPSDATILSATLRYYYYRWWEADPVGRTNDLHKVTSSWSEDTLTWNNKPGYNANVFSSYVVPSSFGWIESDVKDYVQDKINGETDYGIMIKDRNEASMNYNTNPVMYSKEYGSYSPELVIEYSTIPVIFEYCWREGESWDRSYDASDGMEWLVFESSAASDGYYSRHSSNGDPGNYAEYDFVVNSPGTYYLWVRGYHSPDSCSEVIFKWDDVQINSPLNWATSGGWQWVNIGSNAITEGAHTLKVEGGDKDYIRIDNLLITNDDGYTPEGKGSEGSYSHHIGVDPTPSAQLDYEFIKTVANELSDIVKDPEIYPPGEIRRGRSYGTPGERYAADRIEYWMNEYCGLNPVREEIDSYYNDFKRDPGITGSGHYRAKVEHNSILNRLDWVGRRHGSSSVDMYINVPEVTMIHPMFSCRFYGEKVGIYGQQYGLINHFHLVGSIKYFGFGFTMDSNHVPTGSNGLRGEFYDGSALYTTDWIVLDDGSICYPEVYIIDNIGYIRLGSVTESVALAGSFAGNYDEFHFKLGEFFWVARGNGAEGWMDNLEIGTVLSGYYNNYLDAGEGKLNVTDRHFYMYDEVSNEFEEITECYISPMYTNVPKLFWKVLNVIQNHDYYDLSMSISTGPLDVKKAPDDLQCIDSDIENILIPFLLSLQNSFDGYNDFFVNCLGEINESNQFVDYFNIVPSDISNLGCLSGVYSQAYYQPTGPLSSLQYVVIEENPQFNPNVSPPSWLDAIKGTWLESFGEWIYTFRYQLRYLLWSGLFSDYGLQGVIHFDHNSLNETYDMNLNHGYSLPIIYISNVSGYDLYNTVLSEEVVNNYVKFSLDQDYEDKIKSYNVIGEIPGSNPDETVVVGCLYDSWWNQGTGDSAIGVGIMLSIAKYFNENSIMPNRNLRFVAFAGEEQGLKGAWFYESVHRYDENVVAYIDLNQLGMNQPDESDPKLRFVVSSSREGLNHTMKGITDVFDYEEAVDYTAHFWLRTHAVFDYPSDHTPFQVNKRRTGDIIGFIKAHEHRNWRMHHRDGENNNAGDTMYYYFEDDVKISADIIWATVKHLTIDT